MKKRTYSIMYIIFIFFPFSIETKAPRLVGACTRRLYLALGWTKREKEVGKKNFVNFLLSRKVSGIAGTVYVYLFVSLFYQRGYLTRKASAPRRYGRRFRCVLFENALENRYRLAEVRLYFLNGRLE